MVNKPKKKGTEAETRVVNFLLAAGCQAQRVVLHGDSDHGDIHVTSPHGAVQVCLEVKGGQQTTNVNRKLKEDWLEETRREGENAGMESYLVIAKHRASVCDYLVWSSDGCRFWYLDRFVEWLTIV